MAASFSLVPAAAAGIGMAAGIGAKRGTFLRRRRVAGRMAGAVVVVLVLFVGAALAAVFGTGSGIGRTFRTVAVAAVVSVSVSAALAGMRMKGVLPVVDLFIRCGRGECGSGVEAKTPKHPVRKRLGANRGDLRQPGFRERRREWFRTLGKGIEERRREHVAGDSSHGVQMYVHPEDSTPVFRGRGIR